VDRSAVAKDLFDGVLAKVGDGPCLAEPPESGNPLGERGRACYSLPMRSALVLGIVVFAIVAAAFAARTPPRRTVDGRELYVRYCAACHGLQADGNGPLASVLRVAPTDLRRLGERRGRPLPAEPIARFIDGREAVVAHGPRDMPVWGERFHAPEDVIDPRIKAIVAYLETIQQRR
jgi:mono/diheme cytochrome c family protein